MTEVQSGGPIVDNDRRPCADEIRIAEYLAGDTVREATSDEVKELRAENRELKEVVAEITLKNRVLKKSLMGYGEEDATGDVPPRRRWRSSDW